MLWFVFSSDSCIVTEIESVSTPLFGILYLNDEFVVLAVYLNVNGSPWTSLIFSTNIEELSLFAMAE